ncbi:MAG TPA: sigma 54-interacting transcriptional regulator [Polyangiaceae bacterium]|nr:sigma 54-interacting transcriptional regulator [Polyangiaceae bacterium]
MASPEDTEPTERIRDEVTGGHLSLLVVADGEVAAHALPPEGDVVVGRGRTAHVRIDHRSVSREHAVLHVGARVRVEDLGSANGVRVRDVPIARGAAADVAPGDVIDLGGVLLVLRERALSQRLQRTCDAQFLALCIEERLGRGEAPFAVARYEVASGLGARAVETLLAGGLGPEDLVATLGETTCAVLLSDCAPDRAGERAGSLRERLERRGARVRVELRCAPRDGADVRALLPGAAEPEPHSLPVPSGVVCQDASMLRVLRLLRRAARSSLPVLLLGETGVGKEICAALVHECSERRSGPFVKLNAAALAESLVESELFGHERGAFTGALTTKIGHLEAASGGTLFLDEIGDMPLATQVKLLRVFESREITRVGGRTPIPVDVRIVAATHENLEERITRGLFREDLYFRLNGVSVIVPPLRDRPDDLLPLAEHFLRGVAEPGEPAQTLSAAAVARLRAHSFPGNVRELKNAVERAAVLSETNTVDAEHLSFGAIGAPPPIDDESGLRGEISALERVRIERALEASAGSQRKAAALLGISRGALIRRIEKLGLAAKRGE